ncbi:CKLF-like MARVEL transmembrane domain-containing protein 6 [Arapaima gigas]
MVSLSAKQGKTASHAAKTSPVTPTVNVDRAGPELTVVQLLLSLTAFILEELVETCTSCLPLYYFEFASCTAVLFTLLFLIVDYTSCSRIQKIFSLPFLEPVIKMGICAFFLTASIAFFCYNEGSPMEKAAVVFGFLSTCVFMTDIGIHIKIYMLMKAKNFHATEGTS